MASSLAVREEELRKEKAAIGHCGQIKCGGCNGVEGVTPNPLTRVRAGQCSVPQYLEFAGKSKCVICRFQQSREDTSMNFQVQCQ